MGILLGKDKVNNFLFDGLGTWKCDGKKKEKI
jgi:hypothetical protein